MKAERHLCQTLRRLLTTSPRRTLDRTRILSDWASTTYRILPVLPGRGIDVARSIHATPALHEGSTSAPNQEHCLDSSAGGSVRLPRVRGAGRCARPPPVRPNGP